MVRRLFSANRDVVIVVSADPIPDVYAIPWVSSVVIYHVDGAVSVRNAHRATSPAVIAPMRIFQRMIGERRMVRVALECLEGGLS